MEHGTPHIESTGLSLFILDMDNGKQQKMETVCRSQAEGVQNQHNETMDECNELGDWGTQWSEVEREIARQCAEISQHPMDGTSPKTGSIRTKGNKAILSFTYENGDKVQWSVPACNWNSKTASRLAEYCSDSFAFKRDSTGEYTSRRHQIHSQIRMQHIEGGSGGMGEMQEGESTLSTDAVHGFNVRSGEDTN